jgi:hypothetical protein
VRTLEADISQLRAAGRLAPADASVLLSDVGQADRRVTVEVRAPTAHEQPASTTPVGPTTPAGPTAAPAPHGPGPGKGKDKGHGHGHGKGGGGDGGD